MRPTKSQQQAIEHSERNLQLIACAGSGKTEVVARRVVHLLTPGNGDALRPRNIVAFTFTDKAAAELKERIVTRTREALGELPGMAEMFVGTIHAFCLELIKSESPKYLKYEVLNEVQQGLYVDRHGSQSGLTTSTDVAGVKLKRYQVTQRYIAALSILREAERDDANLDRYARASEFGDSVLASKYVKRRAPKPRTGVSNVVFSFSDLKYFFECPYQFKLRVLYGFKAPIHEALGDGVSVVGRIDLVRRIDTGETTIVDRKSTDRAQAEEVTETQLHVYALGYQELTGRRPDYVEIYELSEGKRKPRSVDDDFISDVKTHSRAAAEALRSGALPARPRSQKVRRLRLPRPVDRRAPREMKANVGPFEPRC